MRGHKGTLANFVGLLAVTLLTALSAGIASAQTSLASADKQKAETDSTQALRGVVSDKPPTIRAESERKPPANPVAAEAELVNAKVEPPKNGTGTASAPLLPAKCQRMITADVVALAQPIMLNRLGATIPDGMIFALKRDTTIPAGGQIQLKAEKRPRPIVLRANVGDCLTIKLTNAIPASKFVFPTDTSQNTSEVSLHVEGMEWVLGSQDDGSFVGQNGSSLATAPPPPSPTPSPMPPSQQTYTLYAKAEGTFLMYTMGDTTSTANQLTNGLFGALNVQPTGAEWYRSQVTAEDLQLATYNANRPDQVPPGSLVCTPAGSSNCTFTINGKSVSVIKTPDFGSSPGITKGGYLNTLDNHPLIQYDAVYPATRIDGSAVPADLVGTPILKMYQKDPTDPSGKTFKIVHTDLTAIITGPNAGRFPGANGDPNTQDPKCNANAAIPGTGVDPLFASFCQNPASPDRKQPYREITIMYHGALTPVATQAFPIFTDPTMAGMLAAGQDAFAINYGTGGIGAEIYANRIGVGPMGDCVDCKFEEFFLSAWSVGDPAMLVDRPANVDISDLPAASPVPPLPWLQNTTGTIALSNGSTKVKGTGTFFVSELTAGDMLMMRTSPGTNRCGTASQPPCTVNSIDIDPATQKPSDTSLTLAAAANANASGAFRSFTTQVQPPLPPIAPPWRCSTRQLGIYPFPPVSVPPQPQTVFPDPNCAQPRTPVATAVNGFPYTLTPLPKATRAYYADDPSNVYNSYINDHVKFRILHGGRDVTHVHHQHAHQWLQSPNSDEGSYLDSQMISPGASYTLEMTYNGSGNRNKVVGDSIFHCHFYPHFAAGMWAMWRTHDTFESGTFTYPDGTTVFPTGPGGPSIDVSGQAVTGSRALPDGEIVTGAPAPAIVPLPTLPMAPLPAYAQIQNNVSVDGSLAPIKHGGQVVVGGTCKANQVNGLDVIGGCLDLVTVNGLVVDSQYSAARIKMVGELQPSTCTKKDPGGRCIEYALENPGYPYFIPGVAGARSPHPPLDFAPDGVGGSLDGGLPRHVVIGGSIKVESHDLRDWSKDLATMAAVQLPEVGTAVEQAAMTYFGQRCYPTFFPDGTAGICPSSNSIPPQMTLNTPPTGFILNGLPRKNPLGNSAEKLGAQPGAPFADPGVDDNGAPIGNLRRYKAAAIQLNVTLNKSRWHFPQQRMLTLWKDVAPTVAYTFGNPASGRAPEPLFFRGNSGDIIEYWHTNLVPNYYQVDDFQVRTPTDVLGQHIHLVKFDVTSSDGAGNGFNYEDGTFSPEEVQEIHAALTAPGGSWTSCASCPTLRAPQPPPTDICGGPNPPQQCASEWKGAQTTIQRWYLDPLVDGAGVDRTMRTVFTHDHFGPSTHQQVGLYAGLLIEPTGSTWTSNDGAQTFGSRSDGGPTSWQAIIKTGASNSDSYREFMLEFQDLQLAYQFKQLPAVNTTPNTDPKKGFMDPANAIDAPPGGPSLITTGVPAIPAGTQSVNYTNEPIATRIAPQGMFADPRASDLSYAFDNSIQPLFTPPGQNPDPLTPLMRAYQGDKVQVRVLVGAHVFPHQFNFEGPRWFSEPAWKNSGYRSQQAMGLSEHFEFLFTVPSSSAPNTARKCPDGMSQANCVDYLYSPSMDEQGISNGLWGIFRSYDPTKLATKLKDLPNNTVGPTAKITYATCPANLTSPPVACVPGSGAACNRVFNITAVTAQQAIPPPGIVFNDRIPPGSTAPPPTATCDLKCQLIGHHGLYNDLGIMYVRSEDLNASGQLKSGVAVEPLVLRANAGDCITVNLSNAIATTSAVENTLFNLPPPLPRQLTPSRYVGLHPQLLSYDPASSSGVNVGWNTKNQPDQVVGFSSDGSRKITYQWYAGTIERKANGTLDYKAAEFGSLNLFPSDPLLQHINGLFGQMIIEPQLSTWKCDQTGTPDGVDCDQSATPPTTRTSATVTAPNSKPFREASVMISDTMRIVGIGGNYNGGTSTGAVNYGVEPWDFRYANNLTGDFSCMLSNQLQQATGTQPHIGDPKTPIFTAEIGSPFRFRLTHPFGTGNSQVFILNGHVWQRNPYTNESRVIGDNRLSQWIGSRDNHGSTDHFDLVIDKAGGEAGQAGDYLYSVFQFLQAATGTWGLFRVGHATPSPATNAQCKPKLSPGYYPVKPKDVLDGFVRKPIQNIDKKP